MKIRIVPGKGLARQDDYIMDNVHKWTVMGNRVLVVHGPREEDKKMFNSDGWLFVEALMEEDTEKDVE